MQFKKPEKGDIVSPVSTNNFIFSAFNLLPDSVYKLNYENEYGEKRKKSGKPIPTIKLQIYLLRSDRFYSLLCKRLGSILFFSILW